MTQDEKDFLLKEYEVLKDEQKSRLNFRDQMIYITLGITGTVFSFTLEYVNYQSVLLILPFVSFILGWTYLVNDNKISEIGTYIQTQLIPQMTNTTSHASWECYHKQTALRGLKKGTQLFVDLMLFCISPMLSILLYFINTGHCSWIYITGSIFEFILLIYLSGLFISISPVCKKKRKTG